jgi:hypothetical protein
MQWKRAHARFPADILVSFSDTAVIARKAVPLY